MVKYFLKKPDQPQAQNLVQKIFQAATAENDNPDVRDRAYVYWRLLSSNPQIAQNIILSERPPITTTIQSLPPMLLEQLLTELSTLASVYHKLPESFIGQGRYGADAVQKAAIEYVLFDYKISNMASLTYSLGSSCKTLEKTLLQQRQRQPLFPVLLHPRKLMLRICSTSISTGQLPHPFKSLLLRTCLVWKAFLGRLNVNPRHLHPTFHSRIPTTLTN